jgi:hypothetical protein
MNKISSELNNAVSFIKKMEDFLLPNGKTISEHFTIAGISFWDIMTPYIALYEIPALLNNSEKKNGFIQKIRPHISIFKRKIILLLKRIFNRRNKNNISSDKPIFLFLGFNNYMYRDVLYPIKEKLLILNNEQCLTINENSLFFKEKNEKVKSIWEYWDCNCNKDLNKMNKQIKNLIKELNSMNVYEKLFNQNDKQLWPDFKNSLNWLFNFHFPLVASQVIIAKKIFEKNRINLIFSADVPDPRNRIYALYSKLYKVPLFEIQFGPNGPEGVEWQFNLANKIATWGYETKISLLNHNIKPELIELTGSPRHDLMYNTSVDEYNKMRKALNILEGDFLILFASTYQQKEYDTLTDPNLLMTMKKAVFKAASECNRIKLIVKPHPLENIAETKILIGNYKNVFLVNKNLDIRDLIKSCDIFVGFGSTSTIDAIIANKITICPAFSGWVWNDMFVKSKATIVPTTYQELLDVFKKVTNNECYKIHQELSIHRNAFLEKITYKPDGRAVDRIIKISLEICKFKNYNLINNNNNENSIIS